MMLYPAMKDLLDRVQGRYLLVNIVARRARTISDMAEEAGQHLDKKPVSYAIEEIANGSLRYEMLDD